MSLFGWNFVFVGKHRNQSILRPKKCVSQWPVLWVTLRNSAAVSSEDGDANKGPNRRCIRTSRSLISHVTSWASSVGVIVFLEINFPLKTSPKNHIYLREGKQAYVCFLYNTTLWGSCHENIYIFKFSLFTFLFQFWLGSFLRPKWFRFCSENSQELSQTYGCQSHRCMQ